VASNQDVEERLKVALADRYGIQEEIGRGGMATVYLAQDLKHHRRVAVKVLDPELSAVIGTERFLTEIETTANLQHPNILPLFDSGEADGLLFYVMPFVEGESLRDRLDRETQLPVEDAVRITREIADGLSHAHSLEVIHRDIKPANILLSGGHALIADFGIGRAVSVAGGTRLTETGLSLGTPQYMSPEQAAGEREVDARSDLYALGCVTYEMLAGEPPHTGPNAQAIIAKVLTQPVKSLRESRETVPPSVEFAVEKALARLPADRWGTAQDYAAALTDSRWDTGGQPVPPFGAEQPISVAAAWRALGMWAPLGAISLFLPAAGLMWFLSRTTSPAPVPGDVTSFTVQVQGGGGPPDLALSPDGRVLVYTGGEGLVIRTLDRVDPVVVPGTSGASTPFFSPDGRWIGFHQRGTLNRVSVTAGLPMVVGGTSGPGVEALPDGATWRNDSTIIFVGADVRLWETPVGEGAPRPVTEFSDSVSEIGHLWPQAFADGRLVVFTVLGPSGLWHDASVVVQDLATGERTTVAEKATFGRYVSTGHIVYADASGTLSAVPFDSRQREVTGPSIPVETGAWVSYWGGEAGYTTSEAGTFAFFRGSDWENHLLAWFDREGRRTGEVGAPLTSEGINLSPGGRRIALYLAQPGNADVYVFDVESGSRTRVTFHAGAEDNPVWSPDGRRLAYQSVKSALDHRIEIKEIESTAPPEPIYSLSGGWLWPSSWSPDGRWIAFSQRQIEHSSNIYAIRVDSVEQVIPVAVSSAGEISAQFSPDGHWIAYQSNETGRGEVYVVSFPEISGKQQVSNGGGIIPHWSRAGDELFFWQGPTLMTARVSTADGVFRWEPAQTLFDVPDRMGPYAVAPDGERFLVKIPNPESEIGEIHVVLNWFEVLKALEGT